MREGRASKTAEYMALFRALETTRPAGQRLFDDPYARLFLSGRMRLGVALSRAVPFGNLLRRYIDWRWPGTRTSGAARTRYFDDAIVAALDTGVQQVVFLGAGFDSRAYRLPALARVNVFEVDHPSTSATKQKVISAVSAAGAEHVQFVPLDFNIGSLQAAMTMAGFSPGRPTLIVWEGVSNYLTAEAVDGTLRWCATLTAGSKLIFTYVHQRLFDAPHAFDGTESLFAALAAADEKWTFGIDPAELRVFLSRRGLVLEEDCGATEYRARYYGNAAIGMSGYEFYRIAVARVAAP